MPPRDPDADISPGQARLNQHYSTDYSSAKTGGKFKVDKAHVQKAIDGLNDAIEELKLIEQEARQLRQLAAPGRDPYSAVAVEKITERALDQAGCHGQANKQYREALENMVRNLDAVKQGYANAEEMNTKLGGKAQ
ncbi:hypothetical protein N8J89_06760 [Crossiella sp. CA-258035]|uniref:hypothetical protein n=1 Tax=Crossiella sp. CA-258035 TaxID=2981138 RepID=UPI0024BD10D7|nr:hypothetical protein [Crossiella sp. CA-258035]WHT20761.1 hypothetical protein N8J89_06760 [Crossiella sp. CA-258035]